MSTSTIGIIGDRNPANPTHIKTEAAFTALGAAFQWVATDSVRPDPAARLSGFGGLLIAPGAPYQDLEGALSAIRYARETGMPTLGTCGGFQHMVLEFVRNVLGIADADHAETNPNGRQLAITPLVCSLAGQSHPVRLVPGTKAAAIYGKAEVIEPFFCNYGLNPDYLPDLQRNGLRVSGVGEDGQVRVLELPSHPFFIAALYVPQAAETESALVKAFVAAAREKVVARV
jgi:CTP synthase (UTP-ammonia lyase)